MIALTQGHLDGRAAGPHPEYETVRLSGAIIRGSNGDPLEGALVTAEEMASGDRHCGESDSEGGFRIGGLPKDRMYEVKVEKRGITSRFITVFLSGDKDLGGIVLTSWAFAGSSSQRSEIGCFPTPAGDAVKGNQYDTSGRPFLDLAKSHGGRPVSK